MEAKVIESIRIDAISPAKGNRRIDKASLKELSESIKTHGVMSPVLVRPVNGKYELVYGERRLHAAKDVGLSEIPAIVREMTDVEALEARIIENLQRKDVHPLDEADNYRVLHETHGYAAEDIAAKVGKSKAYVYGRMKLCSLTPSARKAFMDGKLLPSVAELIARIPVPKLQDEATEYLGHTNRPWTFRDAADLIQRRFMLRLRDAGFSKTDPDLVLEAGACSKCPKRTGNQRELFSDVKSADVCTDPVCYRKKLDAHWELVKSRAEQKGDKILSEGEAKKVFYGTSINRASGYVDMKEQCWDDTKVRTYAQLLRKVPLAKVYARDQAGNIRELIEEKTARKALKEAGHDFAKKGDNTGSFDQAERKRRKLNQLRKKAAQQAISAMVTAAQKKEPEPGFWRMLVLVAVGAIHKMSVKHVVARWGLSDCVDREWGGSREKRLADKLKKFDAAQARGLLLELFLEEQLEYMYDGKYPEALKQAAAYFRVDLQKSEAALLEESKTRTGRRKK